MPEIREATDINLTASIICSLLMSLKKKAICLVKMMHSGHLHLSSHQYKSFKAGLLASQRPARRWRSLMSVLTWAAATFAMTS